MDTKPQWFRHAIAFAGGILGIFALLGVLPLISGDLFGLVLLALFGLPSGYLLYKAREAQGPRGGDSFEVWSMAAAGALSAFFVSVSLVSLQSGMTGAFYVSIPLLALPAFVLVAINFTREVNHLG